MFMGVDPKQILQEFAKIEAWRELQNIQSQGLSMHEVRRYAMWSTGVRK